MANLTGVTISAPGVWTKHLDLLREVVPGLARMVTLVDSASPSTEISWQEFRRAAEASGVRSERVAVPQLGNLEAAFDLPVFGAAQALNITAPGTFYLSRAKVAALALQHRLLAITAGLDYAETGLLMNYGANIPAVYRRTATYVDKVLKGAKPADLPVEQPSVFDRLVNVNTAQVLGLTIPQSVAEQVTQWLQ